MSTSMPEIDKLGFYTYSGAAHMLSLFTGAEPPLDRLYVSITTNVPAPYMSAEDLVEVTDRIETETAGDWASASGTIYNINALTWTADVDWDNITGWAVLDSSELGRVLWAGELDPIEAPEGTVITLDPGVCSFSISISDWALES